MLTKFATKFLQSTNKLSVIPKRNFNGVLYQFSPPKNKLSTAELFAMGLVLTVGVFGPSVYIAANMQEYNGKAEARRKGAE